MEIDKLEYYISQRLSNLTDIPVYNKKPIIDDDLTFPYLVFHISDCSYLFRHRKDWILEINYWDDSNDDTTIIEESIKVKNGRTVGDTEYIGLNLSMQDETEGFYQCHIEKEMSIIDPEPDISRYYQKYILKVD